MRTRLELGTSGSIDLMDNIPYSLNYAIADIREPAARNSSYSKTIKIPGSKANNIIFAHIFEINIDCNFNPNLKTPCKLYIDELLQIQGFLRLLKINKTDDNQIEYEVAITGNVGNIFTDWGDKQLTDLDLSAYDHTYNKTDQKASWSAPVGVGYVYPMIDYAKTIGLTYDVENFYPAIYVKQYIDSMFALAGYTYSSSFFNTDFFKRLIIPFNSNTLLLSAAELDSRYFKAKRNANYAAKTLVSVVNSDFIAFTAQTTPTLIQINTDVSDASNQFNTSTFIATISDSGYYTFTASINFSLSFSLLTTSPSTLPVGNIIYFNICVYDSSNNYSHTIGVGAYTIPTQSISNGGTTSVYTTTFTTTLVYLTPGQRIGCAFTFQSINLISGIYLGQAGEIVLNITADSSLENNAVNNGVFDGEPVVMSTMAIPRNIKIKDFFTSIIKMFNLYIETDKTIENKLYIEPRNDFYAAGVTKDWTDKLAIDRVMDIEPMGELNASRYDFKYKEDKDYYNTLYQNKYLESYGTRHIDINTDFVRGTKTVDVIFSATPLTKIGTTDRIISQIASLELGSTVPLKESSNLRILYFELKTTANSWQYTGSISGTTTETSYPYAGHVDEPLLPTVDLSFGVPQEIYYLATVYGNNTLYNKYYKKYIEEITNKDSKIITAYFYLTPLDIYLLDFRNQFFVDGNLLRLNKVYDYNPLSNELTKCEFLRIKEANPFVSQTGVLIAGLGVAYNTGEPTPHTSGGNRPPVINGGTLVANLGNVGNVVDPTVINSVILGSNNYVGAGTSNVTLLGSSGVTVLPGLTNVTLINSPGRLVTESNTTYVNGVEVSGVPSEQGIVAYAGGGQTNAYQTTKKFNLVETCATAGDSIRTRAATLYDEQTFKNVGVASMNVYPQTGEQFRRGTTLLGANVPYPVASRNSLHIYCYETGIWTD